MNALRGRSSAGAIAVLLSGWLCTAAPVPAQSSPAGGWQMVGQVGGPTQDVAVQGNYAYVGVGLRLVVLDISNPAALRELGLTAPFPHFVSDVVVSGTRAYVAAGGSRLRVVDISNPARPVEIGAWDSTTTCWQHR